MPKSAKKRSPKSTAARATAAKSPQPAITAPEKKNDAGSKQSRVIAMLQSPTGVTIAAMMKETDWQQHSVRGFLAGVVRKKLKLKLSSKKIEGGRVYQIDGRRRRQVRPPPVQASCVLSIMPRVKIGPAQPDRKTIDIEIARLRDLDLGVFGPVGTRYLGDGPPLTCHDISCFVFWPIDFRPIVSAIWMPRAGACSTVRDRPRMPASAPWTRSRLTTDVRPGTMLAREWNGRMQRVAVLGRGLCLERQDLSQPVEDRLRHYRYPLEWAPVLRAARQAIEGGAVMNARTIEAGSLRHLHPRLHRPRAGTGLQLPRCPIRCLAGLYPEPTACRLDDGQVQI